MSDAQRGMFVAIPLALGVVFALLFLVLGLEGEESRNYLWLALGVMAAAAVVAHLYAEFVVGEFIWDKHQFKVCLLFGGVMAIGPFILPSAFLAIVLDSMEPMTWERAGMLLMATWLLSLCGANLYGVFAHLKARFF